MFARKTHFPKGRAWIELNMENLRHNTAVLRTLLPPGCELMPVVKANAYGHGAVPIARELNKLRVHAFCVATVQEGAELRRHNIQGSVLVLGYTHPEQVSLLHRYRLTQTVVDFDYAKRLDGCRRPIRVHIGIDTGMHRLGERCENLENIAAMFRMKNLRVDGVFTHLCAGDLNTAQGKAFTTMQGETFSHVVDELRARGLSCPRAHLLGSYGLLRYPQLGGDYARTGIALYGELSTRADTMRCGIDLRPVLSLKARVASVRGLHKGEYAGYGLAFTAAEERKVATLAIGYADGLPRSLSGGIGKVLLNGCDAPILGRICMDQTLVDVTHITGVEAGDIAVLIGSSAGKSIRASDMADQADTITNEIFSRLGERLERVIIP